MVKNAGNKKARYKNNIFFMEETVKHVTTSIKHIKTVRIIISVIMKLRNRNNNREEDRTERSILLFFGVYKNVTRELYL